MDRCRESPPEDEEKLLSTPAVQKAELVSEEGFEEGAAVFASGAFEKEARDTLLPAATAESPGCGETASKGESGKEEAGDKGLEALKRGDFAAACEAWQRGLRAVEYVLAKKDEVEADKLEEFLQIRERYLLNLSLAFFKAERWGAALEFCNKALQHQRQTNRAPSLKALYRKAVAQQHLGDLQGALATVEEFKKASPDSALAISLERQLCRQQREHAIRERRQNRAIFAQLDPDPRAVEGASPNSLRRKKSLLSRGVGFVKDLLFPFARREAASNSSASSPSDGAALDLLECLLKSCDGTGASSSLGREEPLLKTARQLLQERPTELSWAKKLAFAARLFASGITASCRSCARRKRPSTEAQKKASEGDRPVAETRKKKS